MHRRERGVVLFIALLVMVALSLAGIALLRSADTATTVAGNLAFKQAAAAAVDRSIEQAVQALFDPRPIRRSSAPIIADKTVDHDRTRTTSRACGSMRRRHPGDSRPSSQSLSALTGAGLRTDLIPDRRRRQQGLLRDRADVRQSGRARSAATAIFSSAALGADAGTQHYEALSRAATRYYRVTVRVEGPRNTVQYAQAFLS